MLVRGWTILAVLSLTVPVAAQSPALVQTARSGAWSEAATWEGGKLPSAGVRVLIREGHTLTYDVKSAAVVRSLHIAGALTFAADRDTELNVGLIKIQHGETLDENGFDCAVHKKDAPSAVSKAEPPGFTAPCLCCDGKPSLLVGTPEQPIAAGKTALIRLHYIDGMDRESCPAIVCCGGRLDFHGQPMSRTWVKLGANVSTRNGAVREITLAKAVTGWKASDRLLITRTGLYESKGGSEEVTLQSIAGTQITLTEPLRFDHVGEGEYRAEVANLSRNVIVESATPEGVRGHTMYHAKSAGSISYAEFRHLGKEGVLGKYSIHYHLCGDTMRGSSIVGASIHHSKNRWVTIHGTNYLVVRDCVGFASVGHGFFLEDGTEVYNVLDRNLACQALEGKPLPKQMLPFDKNDGAGFWFANAHNTFTRNVAVECGQYGFRFDVAPRAGVVLGKETFGNPKEAFDLTLAIRQPDGSSKPTDVRTLPFVRFEANESHGHGKWGLNLGQHSGGKVGPDPATPFVIRDMKIWDVVGGWGVEMPNVLIDGMVVHNTTYGVRESVYTAQDYRNFRFSQVRGLTVSTLEDYLNANSGGAGQNRVRLPGFPAGRGDGGPRVQAPEIEVAKFAPIDKLPPQTIITGVRREGSTLIVRGTSADDSTVTKVTVNGQAARSIMPNFAEWEVTLEKVATGPLTLRAQATDAAGHTEPTPHELTVRVR